jgi:hypothetical protein
MVRPPHDLAPPTTTHEADFLDSVSDHAHLCYLRTEKMGPRYLKSRLPAVGRSRIGEILQLSVKLTLAKKLMRTQFPFLDELCHSTLQTCAGHSERSYTPLRTLMADLTTQ